MAGIDTTFENNAISVGKIGFFANNINIPIDTRNDEDRQVVDAIEQAIIEMEFLMKGRGETIVFDDGRSKSVPPTVALHWKFIQQAKYDLITYTDALARIRQASRNSYNTRPMFAPNRHGTTWRYYLDTFCENSRFVPRSIGNII